MDGKSGKSPNFVAYGDVKEKIFEHQLSKFSELVDPFSTESENKNYGIVPLNVLHNIMLFQTLPDLLSMSLSCSLFYKTQNSSYFWKSYYYCVYFQTEIMTKNDNLTQQKDNDDVREDVNWKKEFFKRYFSLVYTWGYGEEGELGHGKSQNQHIPKLVESLVDKNIKNLLCGFSNCCSVVLSNGDVLSWGWNYKRLLGHEKDDRILTPECFVQLPENRKIIHVAHGEGNSLFLDEFGDIWGCGSNERGFLIQETEMKSYECSHQPVKIDVCGSPKIKIIVSGSDYFGCICSSGILYTWGYGGHGKLGHGNTSFVLKPKIVKYFEEIRMKDVKMGQYHTLVLSEDGKIYSFGYGCYGQLGNGKTSNSTSPLLIKYFCDKNDITAISCGCCHSGCLDSVGNCYMWGFGSNGEIGNGSNNSENSTPIRINSFIDSSGKKIDLDIPNSHKFVQLDCGNYHNIALLEEITSRKTFVLTWGFGNFGQLGLSKNRLNNRNIPTVVPFFLNKTIRSVHSGGNMSVVIL